MANDDELDDRVVYINRVSKAISGGSTFTFSTMVAVGNNDGRVGIGVGQAGEVAESIRKGKAAAKKEMIDVPLLNNTIPHEVETRYDRAQVLLKPASPGTGVIAGGAVRSVVELSGITDILSKSLGSDNPLNIARATMKAFRNLRDPHKVANLRGISVDRLLADNPYGGEEDFEAEEDSDEELEDESEDTEASPEETDEIEEQSDEPDEEKESVSPEAADQEKEIEDESEEVKSVESS